MEVYPELMKIGFTEYEAKVYLALLGNYPATGYQLGKRAGIPRSMVYEALGRLHARGAVLKTDGERVSLYRPVPPVNLLNRSEQEHRLLIQNLRSKLHQIYQYQDEERLWTINGWEPTLAYARHMLLEATQEVYLVLADEELKTLQDDIGACAARDVRLGALLTGNLNAQDINIPTTGNVQIAHHPAQESALQELTHTLVLVADRSECLIAGISPALDRDHMSATVTNNRNLVMIAQQFVWMELFTQKIRQKFGDQFTLESDLFFEE